jgi:HEAT repeat protein
MGLFGPPNIEKMKARREVQGLIKALGYEKDSHVPRDAVKALGELKDARAVAALVLMLNTNLCEIAIEALGKIGDRGPVQPLLAVLDNGKLKIHLRMAAMQALLRIGALDELIHAVPKYRQSYPSLYDRTMDALVNVGTPAIETFCALLKRQDKAETRLTAAVALGRIENARAVEPLITALQDPDANVRKAVAEALGSIGDHRAAEPLIAALKDRDLSVRITVVDALKKIGDRNAVAPLFAALKDDNMRFMRVAVAEALDRLGWEPDQSEAGVWYWIAKSNMEKCLEIGAPAIVPILDILRHGSDASSEAVLHAFANRGAPAMEYLFAALKDQDKDIRQVSALALGKMGSSSAVGPLCTALKDEDREVRKTAIEAIGKIGGGSAVGPLCAALKDADTDIRRTAVEVLGRSVTYVP